MHMGMAMAITSIYLFFCLLTSLPAPTIHMVQEVRMSGSEEAEYDSRGIHVSTADCDCEVCKCDLYLSAVVSERVPGRCVCPEHAEALGVPSSSCRLLYRWEGLH